MNLAVKLISSVSLGLVVIPSCLYFGGIIDLNMVKLLALIGTVAWFAATPLWMGRESSVETNEVQT